ncbi:hypothetical protein AZH53_06520 [Methanomicrobiaceae archaeon CYW5]|uniref:hypothetical protein n=1 Tax=Methanovulcanius yangii TaxID=1789227 RepID=UPI0029CA5D16|nr:hypothetical protein [Methanovulcanius yangii]MBT8508057.1 hypothetical protein [Methanovulcanius yangii]
MDIIEEGYKTAVEKSKEYKDQISALSAEAVGETASLLKKMADMARPIVPEAGLQMMTRGKQDGKGELYDTVYYEQKFLLLGKTEPMPYRPDDIEKKVDNQYCVLGEDGVFYELMYSADGFLIDSYQREISPEDIIDLYGFDIIVMLYKAIEEYVSDQKELVDALEKVIAFIRE